MPILKGRRLVLAGDHKQLPPTIKCKNSQDLAYTLFDRAMKECPVTSTLLSMQYRMNEAIMEWSSQQFYDGKLVAHESVKSHNINGCVKMLQDVKAPLMFIDTAGSKMGENLDKEDNDISRSKYNVGEADLVKVVYGELKEHGLIPSQIGIIAPYNAQVNLIKQLLEGEKVEISTVDGFQGREKECIIISMVRSNPKKTVGFLADERRMNVAVTRARRFVCLIGDSDTVSSDPVLKTLVDYFNVHAEHRTANDFSEDTKVRFGLGYT
jgi:ATP-dependent RNA/DNA helicase IGHMBP2